GNFRHRFPKRQLEGFKVLEIGNSGQMVTKGSFGGLENRYLFTNSKNLREITPAKFAGASRNSTSIACETNATTRWMTCFSRIAGGHPSTGLNNSSASTTVICLPLNCQLKALPSSLALGQKSIRTPVGLVISLASMGPSGLGG